MPQDIDYDAVLADLEARREMLDAAILAIRTMRTQGALDASPILSAAQVKLTHYRLTAQVGRRRLGPSPRVEACRPDRHAAREGGQARDPGYDVDIVMAHPHAVRNSLILVGSVAFVVLIALASNSDIHAPVATLNAPDDSLDPEGYEQADAAWSLEVTRHSWERGGFDAVAIWRLSIHNKNPKVGYKDIRYVAEYSGPSGTVLTRHARTIYRSIKPGGAIRVEELNDGFIHAQATQASLTIVGAERLTSSPQ